jgi:hypothetical protein
MHAAEARKLLKQFDIAVHRNPRSEAPCRNFIQVQAWIKLVQTESQQK